MFEISVSRRFKATHHIKGLEDRHEHTWQIRAIARSSRLNQFGISIDFKELGSMLEKITKELDGYDLNKFIKPPSSENIARAIFERLKPELPELIAVEVIEGDYGSVEFRP